MKIFKYETEEEKSNIIAEQTLLGYRLAEFASIKDGNFLGFENLKNVVYPNHEIIEIKNSIDILLLKQEGIL